MTLKYTIRFLDYWHMGSGLSAGAKYDAMVIKDSNGMPYIPGKTIKGLVREMAKLFVEEEHIKKCFGDERNKMGECYFSNATLPHDIYEQTVANGLQKHLYDEIASTKIEDGIAAEKSLREIEVTIPLSLEGEIANIPKEPKEQIDHIAQALKMVKRMGLGRNRGLGRCQIDVQEGNNENNSL